MIRKLKTRLIKTAGSIPGWRTKRKIVVIESDDWGSIRMSSQKAFQDLVKSGLTIENDPYCKYDALERNQDLESLYDSLLKFKDKNDKNPVITALCLSANPNFEKIKAAGFSSYHYEPLQETLTKYEGREQVISLWKQGVKNNIFIPQFHGREHLNVQWWMRDLQSGNPHTLQAFDHHVWGIYSPKIATDYQAAFNIQFPEDNNYLHSVIEEGIDLFEKTMEYTPQFFVPTNGPFNLGLLHTLSKKGIRYIMLDKLQKEPLGNGKYKTHIRFLGKSNAYGQTYLSRNCIFEPGKNKERDYVDSCLKDIALAFKFHKPATISTHRVNYIGAFDEDHANYSRKELERLLSELLKKWPEVEFMTSVQLGNLISSGE